jgi:hypothetical protein
MKRAMKKKFKAQLLSGHKDHAVEPRPLWRGRRGHPVAARINNISFESAIVPRQKKFYLLINAETAKSAALSEGGLVEVAVELCAE